MCGGTPLPLQKINYARRNANTTLKDKLCMEKTQFQLQKINCALRNVITTPEDKLRAEEREYDSKR